MRIRRHIVSLLLLSTIALAPTVGMTRTVELWTAGFQQAACLGPCCVVTKGFFEFSCGEYVPQVPLR